MEMCRHGWGSWLASVASHPPRLTLQVWPVGSGAVSGGLLRRGLFLGDEGLGMSVTRTQDLPCTFSAQAPPHTHRPRPPSGSGRDSASGPHLHPACPLSGRGPHRWQQRCRPGTASRCRGCGGADCDAGLHIGLSAGSADTPGPRSCRCCTPTPRVGSGQLLKVGAHENCGRRHDRGR